MLFSHLVSKDVVVDVVLLGALGSQDEGLHEPPHGQSVVGQLPGHLDDHALTQGGMGVNLYEKQKKMGNAFMQLKDVSFVFRSYRKFTCLILA